MDIYGYIKELVSHNKLASSLGFKLVEVSGVNGLEGLLSTPKEKYLIAVDSTGDGQTYASSGGEFLRRTRTIFIVTQYRYNDMKSYREGVDLCRDIFRQFQSRMLRDHEKLENDMLYIEASSIQFHEFSPDLSAHYTGLYFILQYDQPYDISYRNDEWE